MKTPNIVVVGSVNADMVVKSSRLPAPGETVTGGHFVLAPGGKGANQAVAAARLGARVRLVARVGQDLFGDQAIANFGREGIDTDSIVRDPEHHTGVALILVDDKGENLISVASGANHVLTPADVEAAGDVIRGADALLVQLECPLETVAAAARIATEAGVTVILDPAPAPAHPLSRDLLQHVHYLKPNEHEAEQLTGIAVRDESSARAAARKLLEGGAGTVIISLGAKGAFCASGQGEFLVPGVQVCAIDSTAAGDAFVGGLAYFLKVAHISTYDAIHYANLVGALSTTRLGAQPSLPTRHELSRFIRSMGLGHELPATD
jgi:ribokinase